MLAAGVNTFEVLLAALLVVVPLWLAFSLAVAIYARRKNRSATGWWFFAVIVSPLVAALFLAAAGDQRDATRLPCPECAETVLPAARRCPYCHAALAEGWSEIARLGL
jgi:hypothetical protein